MGSLDNNRVAADLLWSAMLVRPQFMVGTSRISQIWREKIYPTIVRNQVARAHSHKSPEPWLTINSALQALSGDGLDRSKLRYLGIVGGAETQVEYEEIASGKFSSPLVLVGGFPRTGTTSLQSVVREYFHSHIVEIETANRRYSLWEYPKHEVEVFERLNGLHDPQIRVVITVRNFEDSVASLAIGRGSIDSVNIDLKIHRWLSWMELSRSSSVVTVPFEFIAQNSPTALAESLSRLLNIDVPVKCDPAASYEKLIRSSGKGDVSSPMQSNVPQDLRAEELASAREAVIARVGRQQIMEFASTYENASAIAMSALRTSLPQLDH